MWKHVTVITFDIKLAWSDSSSKLSIRLSLLAITCYKKKQIIITVTSSDCFKYTWMNGLSCLDALNASMSWSMFRILPGVRVTVEIAGEGGLDTGKFK